MLSEVQLNLLNEILIQPSAEIVANRFDQSKQNLDDMSGCSGTCNSPGGCRTFA